MPSIMLCIHATGSTGKDCLPVADADRFLVEVFAGVMLMDRLLDPVRQRLRLDASFALPHMLQGGTWAAGRKVAMEKRPPNGPPPIAVAADGTVF